MPRAMFEVLAAFFGVLFAAAFTVIVIPPLLESGDIVGAFAAGFVNPYASGYSLDTIICGLILITWVLYERSAIGIRHGWIAIPLTFAPGVATAFGFYLVIRSRQLAARQTQT